jgi:CheY-like chemotaxis protein
MSADQTRPREATPGPGSTVLVVDDDPGITAFLRQALEDTDYRVLTAVDGAALALAQEQQPNVILLDILMPGMDGFEVSQRLRANPTTAHIPIIAMSAQERLNASSALMPVNDRLSKPFLLWDLYSLVAHWSDARREM